MKSQKPKNSRQKTKFPSYPDKDHKSKNTKPKTLEKMNF